jgi:hypothetical protein
VGGFFEAGTGAVTSENTGVRGFCFRRVYGIKETLDFFPDGSEKTEGIKTPGESGEAFAEDVSL